MELKMKELGNDLNPNSYKKETGWKWLIQLARNTINLKYKSSKSIM